MKSFWTVLFALLALGLATSALADETNKTPTTSKVQYDGGPITLECPSTVEKGKRVCDTVIMPEILAYAYSKGIPLQLQDKPWQYRLCYPSPEYRNHKCCRGFLYK